MELVALDEQLKAFADILHKALDSRALAWFTPDNEGKLLFSRAVAWAVAMEHAVEELKQPHLINALEKRLGVIFPSQHNQY